MSKEVLGSKFSATCIICNETKPICCDSGFNTIVSPDTEPVVAHIDPKCSVCCNHDLDEATNYD